MTLGGEGNHLLSVAGIPLSCHHLPFPAVEGGGREGGRERKREGKREGGREN